MMNNKTPLKAIIELYRAAGKPDVKSMHLPLSFDYSPESAQLIKDFIVSDFSQKYITDGEFYIDGNEIKDNLIPSSWVKIEITIRLPRDSIHRFHNSVSDLIKFPSVRNGDFPTDFYITDLDFYSDDTNPPPLVNKVENICRLIKSLSKLAHYHDKKATDGEPRLVFIQGSEGRSKSAILQPIITNEMLEYTDVDSSVVEQLENDHSAADVNHHLEKRGIFRNTLVEFVNENGFDFQGLIKCWTDFRLAYDNNLSVYLSGFNFHKSRKEIAAAELEFAEKTSKAISELTTKVLAAPLSLLAALGIWKLNDLTEQFVILSGLAFTSLIINLIIASQKKQLKRISHSKNMVFSPFSLKLKTYPLDLQADISGALTELDKNEKFSRKIITLFYFLCWVPTLVGTVIIIYKHCFTA